MQAIEFGTNEKIIWKIRNNSQILILQIHEYRNLIIVKENHRQNFHKKTKKTNKSDKIIRTLIFAIFPTQKNGSQQKITLPIGIQNKSLPILLKNDMQFL